MALRNIFLLYIAIIVSASFTFPEVNGEKEAKRLSALSQKESLNGAWKMQSSGAEDETEMTVIKLITDTYYTIASYNKSKFVGSEGGTYSLSEGKITQNLEFFTWDSTQVGTTNTYSYEVNNNTLTISGEREGVPFKEVWEKLPSEAEMPLEGAWRIRERQTSPGKMSIMEWGPRKTIKVLSGNRFQWIAYNVDTGGFFGTGGGLYNAEKGKYTETLEFFSRGQRRVGDKLHFEYEVQGNKWHHKGKSSEGKDLYEIWEKLE